MLLVFLLLRPGSVPHPTKELAKDGASPSGHRASVGTGQPYASLLLLWTMNPLGSPEDTASEDRARTFTIHAVALPPWC